MRILGKLDLGAPFEGFVEEHVHLNDIGILGIGLHHLDELSRLPHIIETRSTA